MCCIVWLLYPQEEQFTPFCEDECCTPFIESREKEILINSQFACLLKGYYGTYVLKKTKAADSMISCLLVPSSAQALILPIMQVTFLLKPLKCPNHLISTTQAFCYRCYSPSSDDIYLWCRKLKNVCFHAKIICLT